MVEIGKWFKAKNIKIDDNYNFPDEALLKIKNSIEKYRSFIVLSYWGDKIHQKVLYALKKISPNITLYEPSGGDLKNVNLLPNTLLWRRKGYILINFDEYEKYKNLTDFMRLGKRKGYNFIGISSFGDDKELLYENIFRSYGISPKDIFDEEINLIDFYDYNSILYEGVEELLKWENRWNNIDIESRMLLNIIKVFVDKDLTLNNSGIPIIWLEKIFQKRGANFKKALKDLKMFEFVKIQNGLIYPNMLSLQIIPVGDVDIKSFLGIDDVLNLKILRNLVSMGKCGLDPRRIVNINTLNSSERIEFLMILLDFNVKKYLLDLDISMLNSAEIYADELKRFINRVDADIKHKILHSLGKFYTVKGLEVEPLNSLTKALEFLGNSFTIARSQGFSFSAGKYFLDYIQVLINLSYIEEPIEVLKKAHNLITKYENTIPPCFENEFKYVKMHTKLHLYYHMGYEEGLKELLRDFKILMKKIPEDSKIKAKVLTSLGIVYMLLGEFPIANTYFEEAEKLQNNKHDFLRLHSWKLYNLLNYADINLIVEDIKKHLKVEIIENAPITYGIYLFLLGLAHYKMFLKERTNKLKSEAISILTSAVRFLNGLSLFKSLAWEVMGDIYIIIGDYGLSQEFYMLSNEYFEKSPVNKMRLKKKIPL